MHLCACDYLFLHAGGHVSTPSVLEASYLCVNVSTCLAWLLCTERTAHLYTEGRQSCTQSVDLLYVHRGAGPLIHTEGSAHLYQRVGSLLYKGVYPLEFTEGSNHLNWTVGPLIQMGPRLLIQRGWPTYTFILLVHVKHCIKAYLSHGVCGRGMRNVVHSCLMLPVYLYH